MREDGSRERERRSLIDMPPNPVILGEETSLWQLVLFNYFGRMIQFPTNIFLMAPFRRQVNFLAGERVDYTANESSGNNIKFLVSFVVLNISAVLWRSALNIHCTLLQFGQQDNSWTWFKSH